MDADKIKPHADALIVKEDGLECQSPGGIHLGQGQIEPDTWLTGHVFKVGDGALSKRGQRIPVGYDPEERPHGLQAGDRICFRRGAGMELGDGYLLLKEHQIVPALLPEGYLRLKSAHQRSS